MTRIHEVADTLLAYYKRRGLRAGDELHFSDLESAIVLSRFTFRGVGTVPGALTWLLAHGLVEMYERDTYCLTHEGQLVNDRRP